MVIDDLIGNKTNLDAFKDKEAIKEVYNHFITQCINLQLDKQKIESDLEKGGVEKNIIATISEVIISRYFEIKDYLSDPKTTGTFLKDFDWKLHLSLSSDRLSTLSKPVLFLNLQLENENSEKNDFLLELNRKDIDVFISTLEKLNSGMWKLQV